jgi:circadian clock protein KaiB
LASSHDRQPQQAGTVFVLRLYVSGASPKSLEALKNVKRICDEHLAGRNQLDVVDIYQQSDRAARDHVVAVPMLVKHAPLPAPRLIGTLSNTSQVLKTFGLTTTPAELDDAPIGAATT